MTSYFIFENTPSDNDAYVKENINNNDNDGKC